MQSALEKLSDIQQRVDILKQLASTMDDWEEVTRLECKVLLLRSASRMAEAA